MNRTIDNFLSNLDSQIQVFIVDQIQDLVESNDPSSGFLYDDSNEEFESKSIKDVLNALKDTDDPLEFKVNQEIFGSSPDKKFKMLVKFWIKHFVEVGWIGSSFDAFCKDFDIKRADDFPAGHEGRLKERIVQRALLLSYSSFFEIKKLLDQLEVKVKYKHTKILLPKLKRIYPSLVSNDDIDFKKLTVSMSS